MWFAVLAQPGEPLRLLEPGVDLLEGLLCRRDPVRKQRAQECVAVYDAALPVGRCAPRAPWLRGRGAASGATASGRCRLGARGSAPGGGRRGLSAGAGRVGASARCR
jgi:hypothetical protein